MIEQILESSNALDRVTIFTPLGIRFWDPVQDAQVKDGLIVTAYPEGTHRNGTCAFRTLSGVYAFRGLPGLHDVEYPDDGFPDASPPVAARFIIQVFDERRRFLSIVFGADLPHYGVYPTHSPLSPPGDGLPGFYLFSAPTRLSAPSLAVVRAQLVERVDAAVRRPAAHAVLEVEVVGGGAWYGVADERGAVAVLFPYPTFTIATGLTSPVALPTAPPQQAWNLNVRVRYDPAALSFSNGFQIPDLRSVFDQSPGSLWSTAVTQPGQPVSQMSAELIFGRELVMRTDGGSTLLVSPAASPP
ncbi:MAG: hypothetical protein JW918_12670 [Anaerolineae bacterium]|nr:hypothetical protein [Anaerolineae bacterium]